jgi:4-amino-4-deoxy-L-arabinose transferase-like glycosyltransferase
MTRLLLLLILLVSLALNLAGNTWGLPDRWNPDEIVADSLRMMHGLSLYNPSDFYHPTLYYFFLGLLLCAFLGILALFGVPVLEAAKSASITWIYFSNQFPHLAVSAYVFARSLSAVIGIGTVYVVYRFTRLLSSRGYAALCAALILACAPGFVTYAHFAKGTIAVIFLQTLTVYLCVRFVKKPHKLKYAYWAFFVAGLALATKYDAAILLVPLAAAVFIAKKWNVVLKGPVLFVAALCLGWPALLFKFRDYLSHGTYYAGYFEPKTSIHVPFYFGIVNYLLQLAVIFSAGLGVVVAAGFIHTILSRKKQRNTALMPLLLYVASYLAVVSFYTHFPYAYTKYIIAIVPCMAVFGGLGIEYIFTARTRIFKSVAAACVLAALLWAGAQAIDADRLFISGDTRYEAGKWIEENIPEGSTLELLNLPDWIAPIDILTRYEILFLGTSSRRYLDGTQFKLALDEQKMRAYFKETLENGFQGDYVLFVTENPQDLHVRSVSDSPADRALGRLAHGSYPYAQEAVFAHPNYKVHMRAFGALSYPKNLLKSPNFCVYTSPTIFIYKRKQ